MKIVIIADDKLKKELTEGLLNPGATIIWTAKPELVQDADIYIDLLFETNQHEKKWEKLNPNFLIVSSVLTPTNNFIRINGWQGMIQRNIIEAAGGNTEQRSKAEQAFSFFNKKIEWVANEPGFITPRIIASIINEAYFAFMEGVSDKKDIDLAMKLGTNYPYGPFEWSELIGLKNVYNLLDLLSKKEGRYTPCSLLKEEALS